MKILPNIILFILLMLMLIGCTTIKYVPVTSVQKDSIYVSDVQKDSVLMWTETNVKQQGDTTIIERTQIIKEIHHHHHNDLVNKEKVDSISEVVEVERKLTKWEQTKMELGGVAIGGVIFAIIALIVFILFKLR